MGETPTNCHTCRWDKPTLVGRVCAPSRNSDADELLQGIDEWLQGIRLVDDMPLKTATGCPGWKPKPAAENTDRAQVASLATDSATRAEWDAMLQRIAEAIGVHDVLG